MIKFEMPIENYQLFESAIHRKGTLIARLIYANEIIGSVQVDKNIKIDWTPESGRSTYSYKSFSALPREVREFIVNTEDWRNDSRIKVVEDNNFILIKHNGEINEIGHKIYDIRDLFDLLIKEIK